MSGQFDDQPQHTAGAYCRRCDAYTATGAPCWLCGSTDLENVLAPWSGWRHNPDVRVASSIAGAIEADP